MTRWSEERENELKDRRDIHNYTPSLKLDSSKDCSIPFVTEVSPSYLSEAVCANEVYFYLCKWTELLFLNRLQNCSRSTLAKSFWHLKLNSDETISQLRISIWGPEGILFQAITPHHGWNDSPHCAVCRNETPLSLDLRNELLFRHSQCSWH